MTEFELQNNQLIWDICERNYFKQWRELTGSRIGGLEIYLLGQCVKHCEYCYLNKHGKELYPTSICNQETIIKNLKITLNWYKEQGFKNRINIFSAEWITTTLFEPVMETFYEVFSDGNRKFEICCPDNMAWIMDPEIYERVMFWRDKLKSIGIDLWFSCSVDGAYCDAGREQRTSEEVNAFYKKLIGVMLENNWNAHPMISSTNIHQWINNYKWWSEIAPKSVLDGLYMLEVRDTSWKPEDIQAYNEFQEFLLNYEIKNNWNNLETDEDKRQALIKVMCLGKFPNGRFWGSHPLSICPKGLFTDTHDTRPGCGFSTDFCVRMGDLSIPLCHRLSYPELLIGQFIVEDDKIVGIKAINGELMIAKSHLKIDCCPHCESCELVGICDNFCLGQSYEDSNLFIMPMRKVCIFHNAQYKYLIKRYYELGLFKFLNEKDLQISPNLCRYYQNLVSLVIGENSNGTL